jgi:hypothetical protein
MGATFMWIVKPERRDPCAWQRIPFPSAPDSKFGVVKMSKRGIPSGSTPGKRSTAVCPFGSSFSIRTGKNRYRLLALDLVHKTHPGMLQVLNVTWSTSISRSTSPPSTLS